MFIYMDYQKYLKFIFKSLFQFTRITNGYHYIKYARIRVFTDRYSPVKDRIIDSAYIRENTGQWKPIFSHILCNVWPWNESIYKNILSRILPFEKIRSCISCLCWWIIPVWEYLWDIVIHIDGSLTDWGNTSEKLPSCGLWHNMEIAHTYILELKIIERVMQIYCKSRNFSRISIMCDNTVSSNKLH